MLKDKIIRQQYLTFYKEETLVRYILEYVERGYSLFINLSQCLTMYLLKRKLDDELVLTDYTDKVSPVYAILSHIWLNERQEVIL